MSVVDLQAPLIIVAGTVLPNGRGPILPTMTGVTGLDLSHLMSGDMDHLITVDMIVHQMAGGTVVPVLATQGPIPALFHRIIGGDIVVPCLAVHLQGRGGVILGVLPRVGKALEGATLAASRP